MGDNDIGASAREIDLADHDWLPARLPKAAQPPAEYAFANLFLFRARHSYRIVQGEVPHLSGVTYDGARHALPLVPLDRSAADILLANHDCLFPFGAEGVTLAKMLGLACHTVDADSDYIYDSARMAVLDGAKARRSQARAFEGEYRPSYHPLESGEASELEQVLDGWLVDVGRDAAATDHAECRQAIGTWEALGLVGGLVRIATGEPVAFLLGTARAHGEHVIHFAKGRRGCSSACPWMFARYAATSGAVTVNFEQDLGNPGFAQSKRSYAPLERRRKYRLAAK